MRTSLATLNRNVRLNPGGGSSYSCALDLSVCVQFEMSETMRESEIIQRSRLRDVTFQASICSPLW